MVPADWVARALRLQVKWNLGHRVVGYGYLWWILAPNPSGTGKQDIYIAMGYQYIFVVPEHDMVVVVTGGVRSRQDQSRPIEMLYSQILPAVKR